MKPKSLTDYWVLGQAIAGLILIPVLILLATLTMCSQARVQTLHLPLHLPPVEFDKPYPGKITVETVSDKRAAACPVRKRNAVVAWLFVSWPQQLPHHPGR
jgi:hypothetical protein